VQRLESQVADLNRQLEALRNQRLPAGRPSQGNGPDAGRPGNDVNDRNGPIRETRERETRQYVVVPGRSDRNLDRGQAAGELSAITAQLNTLKAGQNQLMADQSSQRKLDSLLAQVTALRSQLDTVRAAGPTASAPRKEGVVAADSSVSGNDNPPDSTQQVGTVAPAAGDTVLHSMQDQLAALRRSVGQLQEQLVAANAAPTPRKRLPYGPLVIYYPVNSVTISPGDKQRLSVLARRLGSDSSAVVQVKGFADQTGNAAYNLSLSRKRAEQIRKYLVTSLGVAPERVIVNYFGQAQATDAKQNPYDRRVELELYSTEK
jgi:outer membrane protein OmpA-like peptidoglycan-associated protein